MHVPELGCSLWCKFPTFKRFFLQPFLEKASPALAQVIFRPSLTEVIRLIFHQTLCQLSKKEKKKVKNCFTYQRFWTWSCTSGFPRPALLSRCRLQLYLRVFLLKCKISGEEGLWFEVWLRQSAEGNQVPLFISVKLCTLMSKTRMCKYVHRWTGSFRNCRCDAVDVRWFITSNEIPF